MRLTRRGRMVVRLLVAVAIFAAMRVTYIPTI